MKRHHLMLPLLAAAALMAMFVAPAASGMTETQFDALGSDYSYAAPASMSTSFGKLTTKDIDQSYIAPAGVSDDAPVLAEWDTTDTTAKTSTTKTVDAQCAKQITAAGGTSADRTSYCTHTVTSQVGAIEAPTASDIAAMKQMAADEGTTFTDSAKSARRCRSWSQKDYYIDFGEKHKGRFCYDHVNAYIWKWGGYHYCGYNWGVGYSVRSVHCYSVRVRWPDAQGGYFRQNWDDWEASFLFHGFPIHDYDDMHANVFPSGKIRYHGS